MFGKDGCGDRHIAQAAGESYDFADDAETAGYGLHGRWLSPDH
jgi:hypothetical protein